MPGLFQLFIKQTGLYGSLDRGQIYSGRDYDGNLGSAAQNMKKYIREIPQKNRHFAIVISFLMSPESQ